MATQEKQYRNILVFADGTGNEGGLLPDESQTNVYKLYRATRVGPDTTIKPDRQLAFYVPGIGTSVPGASPSLHERFDNALEQAVGGGLGRKIAQCYVAIISVWRPGDRIYLFGFSRGAYTVRCLAHVLELMGIPTKQDDGSVISLNPEKLFPVAEAAVKLLYRFGLTTTDDDARDKAAAAFCERHASHTGAGVIPYFIGVWDTVSAIGWERFFPRHNEVHIPKGVMFARHAMAIDEYRKDFHRVKWGGSQTIRAAVEGEPLPFKQVWFAGNHADIGGSYPENESRLSDLTLEWMVDFVAKELPQETRLDVDWRYLNLHPSPDGMMHDECMVGIKGSKVHWLKEVRPVDERGELHSSVLKRLQMEAVRNFDTYGPYRPANLENHPQAKEFFI